MFIQTKETPNPDAMQFFPGREVSSSGPIFFHHEEEAIKISPLAAKLFHIPEIEAVFYGGDFITITKSIGTRWQLITPEVLVIITDYLNAGLPILTSSTLEANHSSNDHEVQPQSEVEQQIIEIIETRVRPSVAMDGGDIIYQGFKEGKVYLRLQGACSGCPSSSITLKSGIESMLKHYVPEVTEVIEVTD